MLEPTSAIEDLNNFTTELKKGAGRSAAGGFDSTGMSPRDALMAQMDEEAGKEIDPAKRAAIVKKFNKKIEDLGTTTAATSPATGFPPFALPTATPATTTTTTSDLNTLMGTSPTYGATPTTNPTSVGANAPTVSAAVKEAQQTSSTTKEGGNTFNVEAKLYLKDNAPIETVVQQVLVRNAKEKRK